MPSFAARLMPAVMTLRGSKRRYRSTELTAARVRRQVERPAASRPPKLVGVNVDLVEQGGWQVYIVSPHEDVETPGMPIVTKNPYAKATAKRAIYFHGGSFTFEISPQHFTLIADLVRTTGATISIPIYPLAPVATASVIVPIAADLTAALIAEAGAGNVTIMGDSAGGNIAFAVALVLRDRGVAASRTVLISPVLDVGLTDPRLAEIEPNDPWLALPGAQYTNDLYRGALAIDDPIVSPIYGDLDGLAPVTLFSGTRDMLNADAARLVARAAEAGLALDYHEAPGMIHVYPLLPIAEAVPARAVMRAVIASDIAG